ncbi:MAG: alpha/beta hydrolase domain-containing protein, partial [Vicinamibacteria bacterium]
MREKLVAFVLLCVCAAPGYSEVTRIDVTRREDVLSGREFGLAGAYERLSGTAHFAVDPADPANQIIADIGNAPRNAAGKVEWSADFYLLRPKDARRGNGTVFLEVGNRGGKLLLNYFNLGDDAVGSNQEADFGDGFLLREGFTLLWLGWQWDVPSGADLMRAYVPVATDDGRPLRGLVRADFVATTRVQDHRLADRADMPAYPVADPEAPENVLTVRDGVESSRRVIPRSQWRFARVEGGKPVDNPAWVYLDDGFEPFKIYELVYVSEEPRLVGLGPAGIRDIVSYLKYGAPEALDIPVGTIEHSLAFGVSQSGRFLRTFLYYGFNQDEGGRRVLDGVLAHVAGGGRGSFNHRFAQPSRDAHPYINFFHPTDIFPFTDVSQTDPETRLSEGLLDHIEPRFLPKIFYTNSSYEYWGRAGSLVHTTIDGKADAPMMDNVRVYHISCTQHGAGSFPPQISSGEQLSNPADYRRVVRALFVALHRWVVEETTPPPSRYGRIADGSLVTPDRLNFHDLPGVRQSFSGIHKAY